MHFPLCFRFPLFSKNFQALWKICKIVPFPKKCFHFHPPKFMMTFLLVVDHKLRISSLFSLFQYISPLFCKNYYFPPTLKNFPLVFQKFTCFFTYFMCISLPPTLTMMHLCITQCTYCTPLIASVNVSSSQAEHH